MFIFINTEAIKYHSRLRDESNFILKCEFNAVFVQIVNNKIYGVEYGLFGRYGMKEDLSLREYMDAMWWMMDITSSAWMSANSDSVIQTVSNYNHYSLTRLICTSLFLSQCIILPILIFGFITKRIQQNNTFILPHLIKYIVPTRRMHKHQDIAVKHLENTS